MKYLIDIPDGTQLQLKPFQQWIPRQDAMPDKRGDYIVTIKSKYADVYDIVVRHYDGERWCVNRDYRVIAWMPLPEPYKEEQNGVHREKESN